MRALSSRPFCPYKGRSGKLVLISRRVQGHDLRVLIASFVVPTGQVLWHLGPTRTSEDFAAHLADVHRQLPAMQHYDWVVDNLNTHWSLELCRLVAAWCDLPFVPKALQRGVQRR